MQLFLFHIPLPWLENQIYNETNWRQWGSINARWRYWSRMIGCCVFHSPKKSFWWEIWVIFYPRYVLPSDDLFMSNIHPLSVIEVQLKRWELNLTFTVKRRHEICSDMIFSGNAEKETFLSFIPTLVFAVVGFFCRCLTTTTTTTTTKTTTTTTTTTTTFLAEKLSHVWFFNKCQPRWREMVGYLWLWISDNVWGKTARKKEEVYRTKDNEKREWKEEEAKAILK